MSKKTVVVGGMIALLFGFAAYKVIEKYLEIDDFDLGFNDNDILGM